MAGGEAMAKLEAELDAYHVERPDDQCAGRSRPLRELL
jgi:hypothetical protein